MSQFSIRTRLIFLSVALLATLVMLTTYLTREIAIGAKSLAEQAELVSLLKTANAANKDFGDLKYWLTDLAVSLLVRSQSNASEAKERLDKDLDALARTDPDDVGVVRSEVAALMEQALKAVDSYTNDQRVVGNALMAGARAHILIVDQRLASLVNRLELEAVDVRDKAGQRAQQAVYVSIAIGAAAFAVAFLLTALIVRSITVPLRRLESGMAAITSGKLDVPLPPSGRDEIGAMAQTLAMLRDSLIERDRIAEQREKAEAETRRVQARLAEAIEAISEGFALYDAQDRLAICNSKYREMYAALGIDIAPGTPYEAIVRAAAEAGYIPAAKEATGDWVAARIKRHRDPRGAYEQERSGGRWLKISERRTAEGGIVGVFTDITELKVREMQLGELVDKLADARDQATQATVAKSRFLANMSHELRTPLNAVIGITEMLLEDVEESKQESLIEPLQRIERAGKHLLHLINEVLDLSKIEAGKLEFHYEDVSIRPTIDDAVGAVQALAAKNSNRLVVECADDVGTLHADATRLRQIILNLLSNACKFTEKGTVTVKAAREKRDGELWLQIRVVDTGIGMSKEQLDRLFQEFMQADSSTTRKYGGTGLGLAITDRLCRMMGGTIEVKSEPNAGTTFTVRLPIVVRPADVAKAASETEARTRAIAQSSASRGRTNRILVVDDDPTVRDLMRRFLSREGFDVVTAKDGAEGLALARELHPSLVTLDVLMHEMDGWATLQTFKADPELSHIPIVMMTVVDEKEKGFALGATHYLTKPIDRAKLTSILRDFKTPEISRRALIVEDDATTREMLRRVLTADGWEVSEAGNGREALDHLRLGKADLILLDLLMPEMDGFEFLSALRMKPESNATPVIIVTGADLSDEERRRLSGAVEHILEKSAFRKEELLLHIRQLVTQYAAAGTSAAADA